MSSQHAHLKVEGFRFTVVLPRSLARIFIKATGADHRGNVDADAVADSFPSSNVKACAWGGVLTRHTHTPRHQSRHRNEPVGHLEEQVRGLWGISTRIRRSD